MGTKTFKSGKYIPRRSNLGTLASAEFTRVLLCAFRSAICAFPAFVPIKTRLTAPVFGFPNSVDLMLGSTRVRRRSLCTRKLTHRQLQPPNRIVSNRQSFFGPRTASRTLSRLITGIDSITNPCYSRLAELKYETNMGELVYNHPVDLRSWRSMSEI